MPLRDGVVRQFVSALRPERSRYECALCRQPFDRVPLNCPACGSADVVEV